MTTKERTSQSIRFEVLDVASQAAAAAIRLSMQLTGTLRSQADQLVKSATSGSNNLAEGAGRRGRVRTTHYEIAYGSTREAMQIVLTVARAGVVKQEDADETFHLLVSGPGLLTRPNPYLWYQARRLDGASACVPL